MENPTKEEIEKAAYEYAGTIIKEVEMEHFNSAVDSVAQDFMAGVRWTISSLNPNERGAVGKNEQTLKVCPECKQPYITYNENEHYECNSCDHTWTN